MARTKKLTKSKFTGTKGRLLFLQKYLLEHTDDNHVVTTEDLLNLYKENGFKCQRTTIPDDFAALINSGMDIIIEQVSRNETSMNAYHIGNRLFELPELKLLVDAVSSSRFITAEKSEMLIHKLTQLTNEENRSSLVSRIYTSERLKTSNTNILVNIDVVCKAIQDRKKISFHYWDYTPNKEKVFRRDGEEYIASPYALVWDDDRYYVPAYSDRRGCTVKYRIDRMCDIVELAENAHTDPEFNVAEYTRKVIKMFEDGQTEEEVMLRAQNARMQNILDRFGEDTKTSVVDDNTFRAEVVVVPSSTFFSWVMQYKGEILIEAPEHVKRAYEDMFSDILIKQQSLKTESAN
jgi:predicted DNA-binding transcriptional regulator YafY